MASSAADSGHEFDPGTGLYYFKAPFYAPELGRFASEDPYLGNPTTPPNLHRYLYAYSNPLRYVDLFGYETVIAEKQTGEKNRQNPYKDQKIRDNNYKDVVDEHSSQLNQTPLIRIVTDSKRLEQLYYDAARGDKDAQWIVANVETSLNQLGKNLAAQSEFNPYNLAGGERIYWEKLPFSKDTESGRRSFSIVEKAFIDSSKNWALGKRAVGEGLKLIAAGIAAKAALSGESATVGTAGAIEKSQAERSTFSSSTTELSVEPMSAHNTALRGLATDEPLAAHSATSDGVGTTSKPMPRTWNEFQQATENQFSSRAEAAKAWESYKTENEIITGSVRSPSQKRAFLKQLAESDKTPSWMKPWLKGGKTPPGYAVDHIKPLSAGGLDCPSNMRLQLKVDHDLWHKYYHPWR